LTVASARPLAVLSSQQGLSLYDIAADTTDLLDPDPSVTSQAPRFRAQGLVSYARVREPPDEGHTFGQDSLYESDIELGQSSEFLRLPNQLTGSDWSPDGTMLAYLLRVETPTRIQPSSLCLFDSRSGKTSLLREIERPFGTGTGQREETLVSWAPDGRRIIVVETAAEPSVFVVDLEGHDVIEPRDGTFARWLSEDTVLYQEDPGGSDASGRWFAATVTTGGSRPFPLPTEAHRPSLSPSRDSVAFDDGNSEKPSVYLLDIASGTTRLLAPGYVAPVWLGPSLVAASASGPCPAGSFCPIPWVTLDATVGIDVLTGHAEPLTLPTTLQGAGRSGAIDVFMPIAGTQ
jgi:hypothetical protein